MIGSILSKKVVGVDITDAGLKLVYLRISSTKRRVVKLRYFDMHLLDDGEISRNIYETMREWRVKNTSVILSISSPLIMTKNIEIPSLNQQEIEGIVNLQGSRYTPYARTEIILDYINIGICKRNYTKILLVIVTRDVVKRPLDILDKAGLKVSRILLSSEGLGYFCTSTLKLRVNDPPVGLIHIDANFSDFNIVFKNKIIFIRNISIGANHLLKAGDAYQTKFIEELRKSLESYQNEEIDEAPQLLILTGNVENIKLVAPINEYLHIPTKMLPYLDKVSVSEETIREASTENLSFLDAIAPLMYLERMKVNLIPEEIRLRRALELKSREIVTAGILGIAIFALIGSIFLSKIYYKSIYLKKLNSKYESMRKDVEDIEKKFMKIKIIKNYLSSAGRALDILTEICDIISPNIMLNDITAEENGVVSIKGTSRSMAEVFSFIGKLEDSKYFRSVKTEYTKKKTVDNEDLTDFQISFVLEGIR